MSYAITKYIYIYTFHFHFPLLRICISKNHPSYPPISTWLANWGAMWDAEKPSQCNITWPCGCFLKWWGSPISTPKWSFLVGKPIVVGDHYFRKPPVGIIFPNFRPWGTLQLHHLTSQPLRPAHWKGCWSKDLVAPGLPRGSGHGHFHGRLTKRPKTLKSHSQPLGMFLKP